LTPLPINLRTKDFFQSAIGDAKISQDNYRAGAVAAAPHCSAKFAATMSNAYTGKTVEQLKADRFY
jgi:hypothetical protein